MFFYLSFIFLSAIAAFCVFQMAKIDFKRRIIPDVYLFPFLLIGLIFTVFFADFWIVLPAESILAGTGAYFVGIITGFLFTIIKKNNKDIAPIGLGDVKLLAAGGIWVGLTGLSIAIIISCIMGMIWGHIKGQKYIPFAPFFIIGLIIALIIKLFLI